MNINTFLHLHALFLLICFVLNPCFCNEYAFVCVPVADLIGQPLGTIHTHCSQSLYTALPVCGGNTNRLNSCLRIQQLLFNEIVRVIQVHNDQVEVEVPHLFYITAHKINVPHNTFWTLRSNIILLSDLNHHGLSSNAIPQPFDFKKRKITQKNTVTLAMPWKDSITGLSFSAGTRFVLTPKQESNEYATVFTFDCRTFSFTTHSIPRTLCMKTFFKNKQARITAFIKLLRRWCQLPENTFIPYVWGGCSFTKSATEHTFVEQVVSGPPAYSFFSRTCCTSSPKSGFDCTGLVLRAAHICKIPYFFKNSTTAAQLLKPLGTTDSIEKGDLIWIPGHIIVVSNVKRGLIIEARSYPGGYGKVHEIALSKQFKNIYNYDQLKTAFLNKQPLQRLDVHGNTTETIKTFKILKFKSLWDVQPIEQAPSGHRILVGPNEQHIERRQVGSLQLGTQI